MLEFDAADVICKAPRLRVKRLQAGMLHPVVSQHLLYEELRVGSHAETAMAPASRPLERREQPSILGDIVGGNAYRSVELFDQRAVRTFDPHTVAGGTRVAARAAVDIRDDRLGRHEVGWVTPSVAGGATGVKYRMR